MDDLGIVIATLISKLHGHSLPADIQCQVAAKVRQAQLLAELRHSHSQAVGAVATWECAYTKSL